MSPVGNNSSQVSQRPPLTKYRTIPLTVHFKSPAMQRLKATKARQKKKKAVATVRTREKRKRSNVKNTKRWITDEINGYFYSTVTHKTKNKNVFFHVSTKTKNKTKDDEQTIPHPWLHPSLIGFKRKKERNKFIFSVACTNIHLCSRTFLQRSGMCRYYSINSDHAVSPSDIYRALKRDKQ